MSEKKKDGQTFDRLSLFLGAAFAERLHLYSYE